MKNFKVYLEADNGIQIYGIKVTCTEIKQDKENPNVCYIDNACVDFDMKINRITEI